MLLPPAREPLYQATKHARCLPVPRRTHTSDVFPLDQNGDGAHGSLLLPVHRVDLGPPAVRRQQLQVLRPVQAYQRLDEAAGVVLIGEHHPHLVTTNTNIIRAFGATVDLLRPAREQQRLWRRREIVVVENHFPNP